MSDDQDRIEQIRLRRRRVYSGISSSEQQTAGIRPREIAVQKITETPPQAESILGVNTQTPWLRDRVTLSLEAQIAMIEMRANYRLTLADLGYHNRLQIINIRPGIYLKVEPTGCYRMCYHNRI